MLWPMAAWPDGSFAFGGHTGEVLSFDEKGEEVTFSGNPIEIVKRMRDLGESKNLFQSKLKLHERNILASISSEKDFE